MSVWLFIPPCVVDVSLGVWLFITSHQLQSLSVLWVFVRSGGEFRSARVFLLLFYILISIVLLNLFVGIVTDVYPKARIQSQRCDSRSNRRSCLSGAQHGEPCAGICFVVAWRFLFFCVRRDWHQQITDRMVKDMSHKVQSMFQVPLWRRLAVRFFTSKPPPGGDLSAGGQNGASNGQGNRMRSAVPTNSRGIEHVFSALLCARAACFCCRSAWRRSRRVLPGVSTRSLHTLHHRLLQQAVASKQDTEDMSGSLARACSDVGLFMCRSSLVSNTVHPPLSLPLPPSFRGQLPFG